MQVLQYDDYQKFLLGQSKIQKVNLRNQTHEIDQKNYFIGCPGERHSLCYE